jgi:hypothetical protein
VHPGEELAEIMAQLDTYAVAVRRHVDADRLGLGLWLAAPVAAQLAADPAAVAGLRRELDARGLEVVTFNGFPYRSFHAPVVKYAVYQPDWTTRERLDHTVNLRPCPDRPAPRRRGPSPSCTPTPADRYGSGSSPSRAAWSSRPPRPSPNCPLWMPTISAYAWIWRTLPAHGRSRPTRWPGWSTPGCPW